VRHGKFVNRGFLNGPVCPIYGFGVLLVILLLQQLSGNLLILFFGSVVLTSAIELFTGWILEKVFHAKWWDYTENKFNIKGYICLEFSLLWGLAATFIVRIIHPIIAHFITHLPYLLLVITSSVFLAMILADLAATIAAIRKLQKRLTLLSKLAEDIHGVSDKIGDSISGKVTNVMERAGQTRELYSDYFELCEQNHREEKALSEQHRSQEAELLSNLRTISKTRQSERKAERRSEFEQKKEELVMRLSEKKLAQNRIIKAFPGIKFRENQQALEDLRTTQEHMKYKK
jgi:uncharacterized membrane protein